MASSPKPSRSGRCDAYVSIRHLLPVGGEDSDRLDGPLRLVIAEGDEPFDPRGDGAAVEHAVPGEVIWRDDRGVTCRRWNWRQGARTQLTEDTRSAFFVLDRLAPMPVNQLDGATAELASGLRALCPDAAVSVLKLTADQPEAA